MNKEVQKLREKAFSAKRELAYGQLTLKEAKEVAKPYIDRINESSERLAKKFGVKPKFVNINSFLR